MADTVDYVLGGTDTEQQRLLAQAQEYENQARWLLDQIGIESGSRVIDVGCGPIGILDLLAERVGPHGLVVGLERERRFAEMASREMARRGLGNVRLIQSDGLHQGITDQTFDFVHERLVLVNLPNPESLVSELVRLVRPGGTVALEDIDNVSWVCHPANQSWDVLLDAFLTAFQASGGHPFIGRRLGELLGNGGVQGMQIQAHATTAPPGGYRRGHLLALIGALREKIVGLGLLTESELEAHVESLRHHLSQPRTVVID